MDELIDKEKFKNLYLEGFFAWTHCPSEGRTLKAWMHSLEEYVRVMRERM